MTRGATPPPPSSPGWTEIRNDAKVVIRTERVWPDYLGIVHKRGHDWWEAEVRDGDDRIVHTEDSSGRVAAERKAELWVWHRERT